MEAEGGPEVFGQDGDEAAYAGGPVEADEASTEGDTLGETGSFDTAAKTDVFDDLHAKRFETADLLVGFAVEEVEGSDADGVIFCFGVGDAPGTGGPEAEYLEEAEDGGFVPAMNDGGGDGDEVVGVGGYGVGEGDADGGGVEENVGVGEEQVVGGGLAGGEGHGVGFSQPAGREFGDVEDAEFFRVLGGDGVDDCTGLVGAAVVDGDDVEVGVVLCEERVERGSNVGGFVAGGDDDGNGG